MSGRVVQIKLYFQNDLVAVNEKYSLQYSDTSEPSWILELHGLNEDERDFVWSKYDRLMCPKTGDWVTGETPLIDIENGSLGQYHDVSPFFVTFTTKLNFVADESNPPPNTTDFQPDEVRTWSFTKK